VKANSPRRRNISSTRRLDISRKIVEKERKCSKIKVLTMFQ